MKTAAAICLACAVTLICALGPSLAAEVNLKMSSVEEMKAACQKAGGSFSQDSGGYGCGTDCRGGNGTDCTVFCPNNAKRCTAQVGGARRPKTLAQALAPASKK